ncbi:hypothetical protein LEP1GSC039_0570 [Leptospira santarosai str. 2000027870]|nr:hypothetical protein LEP1GSC039_0570 [Leptospira santarosai str. 2000027870]
MFQIYSIAFLLVFLFLNKFLRNLYKIQKQRSENQISV